MDSRRWAVERSGVERRRFAKPGLVKMVDDSKRKYRRVDGERGGEEGRRKRASAMSEEMSEEKELYLRTSSMNCRAAGTDV